METTDSLQRKIGSAADLESMVRTMKAMAASGMTQFEAAAAALGVYNQTLELGLMAWLKQNAGDIEEVKKEAATVCAIVFGSDQGLVGQFNDLVAQFAISSLQSDKRETKLLVIGERVKERLTDAGHVAFKVFAVTGVVAAIPVLATQILEALHEATVKDTAQEVIIFYNKANAGSGYTPFSLRLLPFDREKLQELKKRKWPMSQLPQVVGNNGFVGSALLKEFVFISLCKACADSLTSENASRLEAMQRAEKNIDQIQQELNNSYHRLRQNAMDEELFDVIAGFEALKNH